ncbi:hypothetical protein EVAR_78341_1 [Eumeta japonica]|uniref:Uncharacterized protein n=1 Tax=Eumeta variegata TaxID=151549 RepID=A0A4C1T3H7_EUMVA|nr:hypothetical protein EVAR_78341_1 [Eumeta japonica]
MAVDLRRVHVARSTSEDVVFVLQDLGCLQQHTEHYHLALCSAFMKLNSLKVTLTHSISYNQIPENMIIPSKSFHRRAGGPAGGRVIKSLCGKKQTHSSLGRRGANLLCIALCGRRATRPPKADLYFANASYYPKQIFIWCTADKPQRDVPPRPARFSSAAPAGGALAWT